MQLADDNGSRSLWSFLSSATTWTYHVATSYAQKPYAQTTTSFSISECALPNRQPWLRHRRSWWYCWLSYHRAERCYRASLQDQEQSCTRFISLGPPRTSYGICEGSQTSSSGPFTPERHTSNCCADKLQGTCQSHRYPSSRSDLLHSEPWDAPLQVRSPTFSLQTIFDHSCVASRKLLQSLPIQCSSGARRLPLDPFARHRWPHWRC